MLEVFNLMGSLHTMLNKSDCGKITISNDEKKFIDYYEVNPEYFLRQKITTN